MNRFARMYSKKFEINEETMRKKLWGNNFYDEVDKKWRTEDLSENKQPLKRAFVQLWVLTINKEVELIFFKAKLTQQI